MHFTPPACYFCMYQYFWQQNLDTKAYEESSTDEKTVVISHSN